MAPNLWIVTSSHITTSFSVSMLYWIWRREKCHPARWTKRRQQHFAPTRHNGTQYVFKFIVNSNLFSHMFTILTKYIISFVLSERTAVRNPVSVETQKKNLFFLLSSISIYFDVNKMFLENRKRVVPVDLLLSIFSFVSKLSWTGFLTGSLFRSCKLHLSWLWVTCRIGIGFYLLSLFENG